MTKIIIENISRATHARVDFIKANLETLESYQDGQQEARQTFIQQIIDCGLITLDSQDSRQHLKYDEVKELLNFSKGLYTGINKLCSWYLMLPEDKIIDKALLVDKIRNLVQLIAANYQMQEPQTGEVLDLNNHKINNNQIMESEFITDIIAVLNQVPKTAIQIEAEKIFEIFPDSLNFIDKTKKSFFKVCEYIKLQVLPLAFRVKDFAEQEEFTDEALSLMEISLEAVNDSNNKFKDQNLSYMNILISYTRYLHLAAQYSLQAKILKDKIEHKIYEESMAMVLARRFTNTAASARLNTNTTSASASTPRAAQENVQINNAKSRSKKAAKATNVNVENISPNNIVVQKNVPQQANQENKALLEQRRKQDEILAEKKRQEELRELEIQNRIKEQNLQAAQEKKVEKEAKRQEYTKKQVSKQARPNNESSMQVFTESAPEKIEHELSSNNLKLLHRIFEATPNDIDLTFTYSEIESLAKECGAKIINGNGSARTFRFPKLDMVFYDISSSGTYHVHEPHGKRGDLLLGVYVKQFREILASSGITPEKCVKVSKLKSKICSQI